MSVASSQAVVDQSIPRRQNGAARQASRIHGIGQHHQGESSRAGPIDSPVVSSLTMAIVFGSHLHAFANCA